MFLAPPWGVLRPARRLIPDQAGVHKAERAAGVAHDLYGVTGTPACAVKKRTASLTYRWRVCALPGRSFVA